MKVYLAAPYRAKDQINIYAAELRAAGVTVTSSWLEESHKPNVQMKDLTPAEHRRYALRDVADVVAADVFVLFTDPTLSIVRQGRTVELGIVIGLNEVCRQRPIYVVGMEFENIFHHLPSVIHFERWQSVRDLLASMAPKMTSAS